MDDAQRARMVSASSEFAQHGQCAHMNWLLVLTCFLNLGDEREVLCVAQRIEGMLCAVEPRALRTKTATSLMRVLSAWRHPLSALRVFEAMPRRERNAVALGAAMKGLMLRATDESASEVELSFAAHLSDAVLCSARLVSLELRTSLLAHWERAGDAERALALLRATPPQSMDAVFAQVSGWVVIAHHIHRNGHLKSMQDWRRVLHFGRGVEDFFDGIALEWV